MIDLIEAYTKQLPLTDRIAHYQNKGNFNNMIKSDTDGDMEKIKGRISGMMQMYIGRPYNDDTVSEMIDAINSELAVMNEPWYATIDLSRSNPGSLNVGLEPLRRSMPSYEGELTYNYREIECDTLENAYSPFGDEEKEKGINDALDLIEAYNERYKPRIAGVLRTTLDQHDHASAMLDRQFDRLTQSASALYDDTDTLYPEQLMRAMPLTMTSVPSFSVSVENHFEEVPMSYSRGTVHRVRIGSTIHGDRENVLNFLKTGWYMIRNERMGYNQYLRVGRDGRIYEYDLRLKLSNVFTDFELLRDTYEWQGVEIEEEDQWFRAIRNNSDASLSNDLPAYSIVDIN